MACEQPFFSIVVPIYNTERYLFKCLETIKNQEHFSSFEVVLVNDGSTDSSFHICKRFLTSDSRFKYFEKENGGLSSARNFGVEKSIGKYLLFVDSDDYVHLEYLATVYTSILQNEFPDIVEFKLARVSNDNVIFESAYNQTPSPYTVIACISDSSVCTKAFKRCFFIESNVLFPVGWLYEDIATTYKLYLLANEIISIDVALYFYVQRGGSITDEIKLVNINDLFKIAHTTKEFLENKNLDCQYADAIHLRFISVALLCLKGLWGCPLKQEYVSIVVQRLHSIYSEESNLELLKSKSILQLEKYVENISLWKEKCSSEIKKNEIYKSSLCSANNVALSRDLNAFVFFFSELKKKHSKIALYGNGNVSKLIKAILGESVCYVFDMISNIDKLQSFQLSRAVLNPSCIDASQFDIIVISILGREKEIMRFLLEEQSVPIEKVITFKK
ncbi:glycosyltransferase family 2 protein [Pseudoalteromonas distincta]|uniref:glycosyltransferase family 2 protein n=1 Tax=Pseudoalteromonas TaxID=53246 RepID=UPI00020A078C|nr:glycosyltransferase family 2 protein [Pseudoalteromonas distincta]EGI73894.1 capsular polysaccharide biosynthesis protein [Pseudoalteromonas distincta]